MIVGWKVSAVLLDLADGVNTLSVYPQVVSHLFASFRVVKFSISEVHAVLCSGFDSRQLHQKGR